MRTVFQKIRDAAKLGRGIYLHPTEVNDLANLEEVERTAFAHDRRDAIENQDLPKQRED